MRPMAAFASISASPGSTLFSADISKTHPASTARPIAKVSAAATRGRIERGRFIAVSRPASALSAIRYRARISSFSPSRHSGSYLLEIDPLVHRKPLQMPAEAVEAHFDRAQANPLAAADDAASAGGDVLFVCDR